MGGGSSHDFARWFNEARRNIVMKDGLVLKDRAVVDRLDAAAELQKITAIDALAQPAAEV